MLLVIAALTVLGAILSLGAAAHSWRKVDTGAIDAATLSDLTGLATRADLDRLFRRVGPDHYAVTRDAIDRARTKAHRLLGEPTLDALSVLAAFIGALLSSWPLVILAAGYELISWGWTAAMVNRRRDEAQDARD